MKKTLGRYIISEILPPFLIGLLAFTVILLTARIVKLVELFVTRGLPMIQIGKLLGLILPTFLEMTLPMALLLGIFLGLSRLSSDQEILAFKASGISPYHILLPVATLAALISLATLVITMWVRPAANLSLQKELYTIAKTRVATALKEKVFNDYFPGILIYAEELAAPGNTLQGVFIVDRRNPARETIIIGKVALLLPDEESNTLSLKILDGSIHEREKKSAFSRTHFNIYNFKLNPEEVLSSASKRDRPPKEMSLRRLRQSILLKEEKGLRATPELMEIHQRISFAFAPLVFGLLGVSFVLVPTRSRTNRAWGLTLCLFWLLSYYALLSLGKALGEREILPAAIALWLPNVIVGLIAARLFKRALNESPLFIATQLKNLSSYLTRRLAAYRGKTY